MAGFLKNRRPFLSGYYLVDNLKGNYEIPSIRKEFIKPGEEKTSSFSLKSVGKSQGKGIGREESQGFS